MNDDKLPKSFKWLNITQFLGALNDNAFRWLVFFLLVRLLGDLEKESIVAISALVFVLPFLLFSHAAGVLADRISKRSIVVFSKFLEVCVMLLGCLAITSESSKALYGVIFLMSTQSAIFSPSKYGIIPELVGNHRLTRANSQLVGASYLGIIIGTFLTPFMLGRVFPDNFLRMGLFCVAVAVMGAVASLQIEKTRPMKSGKRFTPFFVTEIFKTLYDVGRDRYLLLAILGSSYFLYIGAFIQQNIILYGQDVLALDWYQSGYLFPMAALGIGLGSLLAGRVSGRNIEFGVVPVGALGLTVTCVALHCIPAGIKITFLMVFLIGLSSGMFIVPLNSFIQFKSPEQKRGEVLACVNFLSFTGVALAAGTIKLLAGLGMNSSQGFLVIGLLTAILSIATLIILPDFFVRFIIVVITRLFYRIRVVGLENVPVDGPALLVSNHVTWVDSLLISATQQRRIRFVMARDIFENKWVRPLFRLMKVIPVSRGGPRREIIAALKEARSALDDGYLVCIFAEGAITRNGNMRAFKSGLERIVKDSDYPIVPVHIGEAWGSIFSHYHGRLLSSFPRSVPYPVSLIFGVPLPASSSTSDVERAVIELSTRAFDLKKSKDRSLSRRFVRMARKCWFRPALSDTTGKRLNFGAALTGSIALSAEIEKIAGDQDRIGIVMPASVGGALANIAITLMGKVPVNLNFTASEKAVESAISRCGIKTVVSSRAFLEKLDSFKAPQGTVFLEDILPRITAGKKCIALAKALFASPAMLVRDHEAGPDDLATIIFSSGSTAEPKGVMLSHHNIISNIESFSMVFRFNRKDNICAVLPFFHSFGFTCTLWCPLIIGFSATCHANPMDGAKVAEVVRENSSTILMTTPTFLLAYIRRAKREDFATLRAVIVGAEKLKKRVSDSFEETFGIRPLEGYGTTELSPVVGLNLSDVEVGGVRHVGTKEGSVGHPIPGTAVKIVDPESGAVLPEGEEGLLMVKGPNVMTGYLNDPEKTAEVLRDGWYDTGDIAKVDGDGFVFLLDRMSRFSKIGGEMVPHIAVEEQLMQALGTVNQVIAVTSAPDEKKGEQLVVFYTDEAGDPDDLQKKMKESDLPNLWKPRKDNYVRIELMPTLGSGKLDLKRLKLMAGELVDKRPGLVRKAVDKIRETL